MEAFLHAISAVGKILLMTMVGYFAGHLHLMNAHRKQLISKFLMTFGVPIMCIYGISNRLDPATLMRSVPDLLVPFFAIILCMLAAWVSARMLHFPRKRTGVYIMMCSLSNSMFVGYAMCTELFGEAAIPNIMLFYIVNTSFVQLVGLSLVRWSGGESMGFSPKAIVTFLTTPCVIAVFVSCLMVALRLHLPAPVNVSFSWVNKTVTPLALLLTGYILYEIGLRNLRLDRDLLWMLFFRFLVSPAVSLVLCDLAHLSAMSRNVLIVEAAMPTVTMTAVAAVKYHADDQFAAQGAVVSTLACFIVIPVLILFL